MIPIQKERSELKATPQKCPGPFLNSLLIHTRYVPSAPRPIGVSSTGAERTTMRKTTKLAIPTLAKPAALRHAVRREQKARLDKPVFDPADAPRWIDKHGRFTIPHTKGKQS